jgi:hypothetical protein
VKGNTDSYEAIRQGFVADAMDQAGAMVAADIHKLRRFVLSSAEP